MIKSDSNHQFVFCTSPILALFLLTLVISSYAQDNEVFINTDETLFKINGKKKCELLGHWIDEMFLLGGSRSFKSAKAKELCLPAFNNKVFIKYFGKPYLELNNGERREIYKLLGKCHQDAPMYWKLKDAFDANLQAHRVYIWKKDVAKLRHEAYNPPISRKPDLLPTSRDTITDNKADLIGLKDDLFDGVYQGVLKYQGDKSFVEFHVSTSNVVNQKICKILVYPGDQRKYNPDVSFIHGTLNKKKSIIFKNPIVFKNYKGRGIIDSENKLGNFVLSAKGNYTITGFGGTLQKVQNGTDSYALIDFIEGRFYRYIFDNSFQFVPSLKIRAPFSSLSILFQSEVIRAQYDSKNYDVFEMERELREYFVDNYASKQKISAAIGPFHKASRIELYPKGTIDFANSQKHFDIMIKRSEGTFVNEYTIRPTNTFADIKGRKEQQISDRIEHASNAYKTKLDLIRSSIPEDQRISFDDFPIKDTQFRNFIRDVYYSQFDRAKEFAVHKSALFTNYHMAITEEYGTQLSKLTNYGYEDFQREHIVRSIYVQSKYYDALKRHFQGSIFEYSNALSGLLSLAIIMEFNKIKDDIYLVAKYFPPNSGASIRLNENLFRYVQGLDSL